MMGEERELEMEVVVTTVWVERMGERGVPQQMMRGMDACVSCRPVVRLASLMQSVLLLNRMNVSPF